MFMRCEIYPFFNANFYFSYTWQFSLICLSVGIIFLLWKNNLKKCSHIQSVTISKNQQFSTWTCHTLWVTATVIHHLSDANEVSAQEGNRYWRMCSNIESYTFHLEKQRVEYFIHSFSCPSLLLMETLVNLCIAILKVICITSRI